MDFAFFAFSKFIKICVIGSHKNIFDVVRTITFKQQNFCQSDPFYIRQFSKKLQSDAVLIRPQMASVLIQS